jgi:hypothetical protein
MEGRPTFLRRLFDAGALIDATICRFSRNWQHTFEGQIAVLEGVECLERINSEVFECPATNFGCTGTSGLSKGTNALTSGWQRLEH